MEDPIQNDDYNCGIFVCKFVSMLLEGVEIKKDSFHQVNDIDEYRANLFWINIITLKFTKFTITSTKRFSFY